MGPQHDGKTRRSILIAAGAAAAIAGGAASPQAQPISSAQGRTKDVDNTMRKILAVAVGNDGKDLANKPQIYIIIDKDTPAARLDTVRPYIKGLIGWLADNSTNLDLESLAKTFVLGDGKTYGYTIDYREASVEELNKSKPSVFSDLVSGDWDCIVCMSSFVGEVAAELAKNQSPDTPIVVVTSDPSNPKFENANVCGVCAIRPQLMGTALHKLKKMTGVVKTKIYGLHREKYPPSLLTQKNLGKAVKSIPVKDGDSDLDIKEKIQNISKIGGAALLVFPVDRFFGIGDVITTAAGNMPTYWSTNDWPKNSTGGYGFPQKVCGEYMAQRVREHLVVQLW